MLRPRKRILSTLMFGCAAIALAQLPPYDRSPVEAPPPAAPPQAAIPPAAPPDAAQAPLLPPEQLDNLVAPIALYPDPLLGEVLAASTYPLEIVEAQQWLQQNGALQGSQLMTAARQQNWDASVQALVAFPNVLSLLNND